MPALLPTHLRSRLFQQLADAMRAGLTGHEACAKLAQQSQSPSQQAAIATLSRVLSGEASTTDPALAAQWSVSAPRLLEAGLRSGRLVPALELLSELTEQQQQRWRKLAAPLLVAVLSPLGLLMAPPPLNTVGSAQLVILGVLLAAALIAGLITVAGQHPRGREVPPLAQASTALLLLSWRSSLLSVWFRGPDRSRFTTMFAMSLESGLELSLSLEVARLCVLHPAGQRLALEAAQTLDEGATIAEILAASELLEPYELSLVVSGEQSGRLVPILTRISQDSRTQLSQHRETTLRRMAILPYGIVLICALAMLLSLAS